MERASYATFLAATLLLGSSGCPDDAQIAETEPDDRVQQQPGPPETPRFDGGGLDRLDSATPDAEDAGYDAAVAKDAGADEADAHDDAALNDKADASDDAGVQDDAAAPAMCGRVLCDCTLNGIPLFGKVQVVTSFADFKVRDNDSFPDLNVQETSFPDDCGQWQFVEGFGDFTIQWENSFPDFAIKRSSFPGLANK